MRQCPERPGLLFLFVFLAALVTSGPAFGQSYTVPTTPEYTTPQSPTQPGSNQAPGQGGGEAPGNRAPSAGAGPGSAGNAPQNTIRTQTGNTLPHTGFEDGIVLAVAGAMLLLAGATIRRSIRRPNAT
jgi:LPXTG-motif cell wall-anchored protein